LKVKQIIFVLIVAFAAFLTGIIWAEKALWPYSVLAKSDFVMGLKARIVRPERILGTTFSALKVDSLLIGPTTSFAQRGGGIYAFDNKVLIMSYRADFVLYESGTGERSAARLDIEIDNDYERFQEFTVRNELNTLRAADEFRFIDIIYHRESTSPSLLVSHHQWHDADECYTLRISRLDLDPDVPLESVSASTEDWKTVYDTTPCLSMKDKGDPFAGTQAGGRIVLESPNSVLFSVGDHDFDGWNSDHIHAQDPSSDYGKIIRVDIGSGKKSPLAYGVRNPQGLLIDDVGNVWETEHGPRGGDELNLINRDSNYGWPRVTYGAQYGRSRWPLSETQNSDDGYARPVYAWLPSIGISNLIQVRDFVPEWSGDLLVSSLGQKSLHRLRVRDGRVIFDEPVSVGVRIRDIDQLENGNVVLWGDDTSIIELSPTETIAPDIEKIVSILPELKRQQASGTIESCQQCHGVSPYDKSEMAPTLWGIYGRKIGATDFDGYSNGLKSRSGKWNETTLDKYLANVQAFSADSTMAYPGISDEDIRMVTIEYLRSLR
jgi:cytochrome c2